MSLLKEWRDYAYGLDDRTPEGKEFWVSYFQAGRAYMSSFLLILLQTLYMEL